MRAHIQIRGTRDPEDWDIRSKKIKLPKVGVLIPKDGGGTHVKGFCVLRSFRGISSRAKSA